MTRELYLVFRRQSSPVILYEWYKEKFDANKHHPFLNHSEFFTYLSLWGNVNEIYKKTVSKLDEQFNVVVIMNSKGEIINYV